MAQRRRAAEKRKESGNSMVILTDSGIQYTTYNSEAGPEAFSRSQSSPYIKAAVWVHFGSCIRRLE